MSGVRLQVQVQVRMRVEVTCYVYVEGEVVAVCVLMYGMCLVWREKPTRERGGMSKSIEQVHVYAKEESNRTGSHWPS